MGYRKRMILFFNFWDNKSTTTNQHCSHSSCISNTFVAYDICYVRLPYKSSIEHVWVYTEQAWTPWPKQSGCRWCIVNKPICQTQMLPHLLRSQVHVIDKIWKRTDAVLGRRSRSGWRSRGHSAHCNFFFLQWRRTYISHTMGTYITSSCI